MKLIFHHEKLFSCPLHIVGRIIQKTWKLDLSFPIIKLFPPKDCTFVHKLVPPYMLYMLCKDPKTSLKGSVFASLIMANFLKVRFWRLEKLLLKINDAQLYFNSGRIFSIKNFCLRSFGSALNGCSNIIKNLFRKIALQTSQQASAKPKCVFRIKHS